MSVKDIFSKRAAFSFEVFPPKTDVGMEKLCAARGLAGRLIPVPRALTADCGMAWRAEIDKRAAREALAAGEGLEVEGFYELTL